MSIPILLSIILYCISFISVYYTYIFNKTRLVYLFNITNFLNGFSWLYIKFNYKNNYIYTYIFYNIFTYFIWNCIINYILYYYNKTHHIQDCELAEHLYLNNDTPYHFSENKQNWNKINELDHENKKLRNEIALLKKHNNQ